ncbi:MAG: PQQ-dependent sugar dehydrogenase [Caldilinea sp.]|nr:PQQ-dependent sugar dehydrogenase [Caldilinea sp.]MDW8441135.1 PQQ-dependent sugar dehydrogenase [Caldilineaceae bacterium]
MACLIAALVVILFLPARGETNVDEIALQEIASGFSEPVYVTHAGDGSGRLFVVEKAGLIKILQNGQTLSQPFLDIRDRVGNDGEAGLLSVAFPPDFAQSGYFFVYYNHKDKNLVPPDPRDAGNNNGYDTVVARFRVTGDPNRADPNSEERILLRNQPYANHNGGLILFGPDGRLYIGLGDGGSAHDPLNAGQDLNTWLGKLLRIEVGAAGTYTVPSDNPFVGRTDAKPEIWDWGLRNPWRFSFDRLTGDLFIGDVGQGAREEISLHPAGQAGGLNFGWDCREGDITHATTAPCDGPFVEPIVAYPRSDGQSVTGGYVYRGVDFPRLHGRYFFADFVQGRIWSIQRTGGGWSAKTLGLDTEELLSSFGEDERGELYIVAFGGTIYRLVDAAAPGPTLDASTFTASPTDAVPGDVVTYHLVLRNGGGAIGGTVQADISVPGALTYLPQSLQATAGAVDDAAAPLLRWQGTMGAGQVITVTYQTAVNSGASGIVTTTAQLNAPNLPTLTRSASLLIRTSGSGVADPDFFLPGTQPAHIIDPIVDPTNCQSCHTTPIYGAWRGSMKSQAGRDPLFWAALHIANQDVENAGEFCLRCHTPRGWFSGRSHPADASALSRSDLAAGVACETCHRMVDPEPSGGDTAAVAQDAAIRSAISPTLPAGHIGSAMLILDPEDNRRGPFSISPAPPHPKATWRTDLLGQGGDPVTEARVCGVCHNLDNPTLSWNPVAGRYEPNEEDAPAPSFAKGELFPIERTFDEWLYSAYATAEGVYAPQFAGAKPDGIVRTCQDCHMPRTTGVAASGGAQRDCAGNGCLPEHSFVGANTWAPQLLQDSRWRLNALDDALHLNAAIESARSMLRRAATLTVDFDPNVTPKQARVRVTNETGHKLPTGYPEGRRIWLNVRAYDAAGRLVFESGAYDPATGLLQQDPQIKIYEAKLGIDDGATITETFHFIRNNTVIKDNRIPPRGYTVAAYDQPGLRPVGAVYADGQYWEETTYTLPEAAVSVVAVLYYQTASKEYIDFLRARGGADGAVLGQMWDDLKSPPEAMAMAMAPAQKLYFPLVGR